MSDDRAIGLHIPAYEDKHMIQHADFAYWEAIYSDGTMLRETDFKGYDAIDRDRLVRFQVVYSGEIIVSLAPPAGATGRNLVWRRRTRLGPETGRRVILLVGYAPMGPIYKIDVDAQTIEVRDGFDPNDPTGDFHPPTPLPGETEEML